MKMRHHSKLTVSRRLELYKSMGGSRHKRRVRPGFHHNKAIVAAVFQLVCGAAALMVGTISVITNSWGYYFGCGFWGGSFFLAAGLCGIVAGIRKNNTPITIFVVFSGIAFVLAVIMLALTSVGISPRHSLHDEVKQVHGSSVVVLSLHLFIAIVEILASVISIAISLRAVCMTPHSDRQYEIAVQSPVSSEFAPQAPPGRSNSYGQYELCSDFDTEFTVSDGLTPLAPSSQLPTTCTEELPILSSVLENNATPDDSTCLLQQTTEPDTLLDSPAVASITAQEENAVNDLLENSPVGPPGTPPPSYRQAAKRGTGPKGSTKSTTSKTDNKGKTATTSKIRGQDTSKKPIAPLAKPPSGPTRRNRTTSEPTMKKSASQTSNRSMQSAASYSRQTSASYSRQSSTSSIRSRADSSSSKKDAEGGSPAKHKRPSHLDIPPKGTSSRTRGQVRSRSSRSTGTGSQQASAAKPVPRGASQSQRGARTPSSRTGPAPATSSGANARGLTRSGSRTSTSSLKGATSAANAPKTAQEKKPAESATSTAAGSSATKSTKANQPARPTTSQNRGRPGSQSSAGGSRPRNQTGARAEGSGNQPQRSPLDTLL